MNQAKGEICYWELYVEPTDFEQKHPYASGKLSEVYMNLALDVAPPNVKIIGLQGTSIRNATTIAGFNATSLNSVPISRGKRVILAAYPTTTAVPSPSML